jgi:hypothetical protein
MCAPEVQRDNCFVYDDDSVATTTASLPNSHGMILNVQPAHPTAKCNVHMRHTLEALPQHITEPLCICAMLMAETLPVALPLPTH